MGTRFLSKDERNTLRPNLSRLGENFYFASKQPPLKMTLPGIKFDVISFYDVIC